MLLAATPRYSLLVGGIGISEHHAGQASPNAPAIWSAHGRWAQRPRAILNQFLVRR